MGIDPMSMMRGASTGFSILLLGGLTQPIVSATVPVVGRFWLTIVAIIAFVVAGGRIGRATAPAIHGAVTAILAYLLVLPLVLMGTGLRDLTQIGLTLAAAVVVGAATGALVVRRRGNSRTAEKTSRLQQRRTRSST